MRARGVSCSWGRTRVALGTAVITAIAALGASTSLAAVSNPALSLKAKHTIVPYTKSALLRGALSSGKKGVLVELQQRVWPFKHAYKTVAKTHTGARGAYSFKRRPSLATKYRAVAPKAHATSRSSTVYVVKGLKVPSCEFTRPGYVRPCSKGAPPPGKYTWRVTIEYLYPASVYAKERGKPVYSYYGIRRGSDKRPSTLKRKKTVRQHPHGRNTTVFKSAQKVVIPSGAWYAERSWCTMTTEPNDGFGLPGAPGSHRCGQKSIPGNVSIYKLG